VSSADPLPPLRWLLDWHDHSYGLTGTGKSTALEALRARATGPRTIPWP
jgi:hypothetical protein